MNWKSLIREIPDFPKPGIVFRDITPVLAHPQGLSTICREFVAAFSHADIHYVAGIESRGFIIGAPTASTIGCGFVPVRKAGKLPAAVHRVEYALEYGTDQLEMHRDAIAPGSHVLVIDDVIATGGTAKATYELVQMAGGVVIGFGFMVELVALGGRRLLPSDVPAISLVAY